MEVFSVLCAWRGFTSGCLNCKLQIVWKKPALCKSQTLRKSHVIPKDHWLESWIVFFLDTKFYGHLNAGILQEFPNWHTTSLSCFVMSWWMQHVISFFQENVSSRFLFLSFTPLCHLAALLLCLWHHEILWMDVISHDRSHCRHGRYPAFMRLHFNHQTVPTSGKTFFPDVWCEARKERLRVPSHAPSKGTTRLIDASSAVEDSQYCLMTGHVFNCLFTMVY